MKLVPESILKDIPPLYATEEQKDPIAYVKLFTPNSSFTWYITEVSKNRDICFGYVVSHYERELGYFSLSEIDTITGNLGLELERDLFFVPTLLSKEKAHHEY